MSGVIKREGAATVCALSMAVDRSSAPSGAGWRASLSRAAIHSFARAMGGVVRHDGVAILCALVMAVGRTTSGAWQRALLLRAAGDALAQARGR